MSYKIWVITSQVVDTNKPAFLPELVENISGRKKIAFIDDYLCDLYEDMLDEQNGDMPYDDQLVRSKITHPSGSEVVLEHPPLRLRAVLQDFIR